MSWKKREDGNWKSWKGPENRKLAVTYVALVKIFLFFLRCIRFFGIYFDFPMPLCDGEINL